MRLGVIGVGRWGGNIVRALAEMSGVRVSCVASRNPGARAFVDGACVIERDWRRLLRRRDLDAVVVATPPAVHAEIAAEAVSVGLPVFVEKPLTCNLREAERLFDLVAQKNGYILVDHIHLFSHAYRALKARLAAIGSVRRICSEAGAWGPFRSDTPVLWDWGPHDAAFCLDLLGERPLALRAERLERRPVAGGWGETLVLHATYSNAVTAHIRLSNLVHQKRRTLAVGGSDGTLLYDDCAEHRVVYRPVAPNGADQEIIAVAARPPLECALARFVDNVTAGHMSLEDLRFGVDVVRMLDAWDAGSP